jgi:competence protein ComGF
MEAYELYTYLWQLKEEFEDTKGVIRVRNNNVYLKPFNKSRDIFRFNNVKIWKTKRAYGQSVI